MLGLAAVVTLLVVLNPAQFARSVAGFRLWSVPAVVGLSMLYYLLQGLRWQPLLRAVGVRLPLGRTLLLNLSGQATGLLPLGELTRAVLVSEATGSEFGAVVATITVQELVYTLIIIAAAVPGALGHPAAAEGIIAALVGTVMVLLILTNRALFRSVIGLVCRMPLVRRIVPQAEQLQRDTVVLLRRWDTWAWSVLSVAGAMVAITLFWLVVDSLRPGFLSWQDAAFVYAVSHVVGAITLSPGGLGGFEASVAGLLIAVGADPGTAAAAALVQRAADKGLATLAGLIAFMI
ncbi:MAG TPA: lysylphosphatidylglycerol synthase transmembrane domain-containing protein, partial [Candidatus Dormibacteraeota bacterium]|nr:lysylphosphatidylglycerol synthase transmembrane domain-containing protein [Candidatus Dormibacteraeota bacterium]